MTGSTGSSLFDEIRSACAQVAERARFVRIVGERLVGYTDDYVAPPPHELPRAAGTAEERAAFVLMLDAINFGSGWFPHLRKPAGLSGYRTVERRLIEWFEREGVPDPSALRRLDARDCARLLDQPVDDAEVMELMALFGRALRDLGAYAAEGWLEPVRAADGSAERLVRSLLAMPLYRDVSRYDGLEVPFLKRAQITVEDLAGAGVAEFADLDRLTIFADNLVPHVLRIDGVLELDPALEARIEAGELLEHGSPEEVEIRACALHAAERLARPDLPARRLDQWLWHRGGGPAYKARPRHRARCPFY